jgi:hypothetical protein
MRLRKIQSLTEVLQHLAELLTYAVGNTFGAYYIVRTSKFSSITLSRVFTFTFNSYSCKSTNVLFQPVFSALTEHGRLTLRALSQRTGQSSELVAQALSGLLQQNLVLYFTDSDKTGDASYEPNWETAYNLTLRAGTLVKLINARHGERVGEVFDEIMVAGVARVGDLIQRFSDEPDKHDSPQKSSVNGDTVSDSNVCKLGQPQNEKRIYSAEDTEAAIEVLLRSGLVLPLHTRQFWPGYDLHQEAEIQVKLSRFPAGCNTKKDREACAELVEELMRAWREEYFNFTKGGLGTIQKRARSPDEDDDFRSAKRQKTQVNGQALNGVNGTRPNHYHLDVSLSCTQQCASHRAIAKPLSDQSRTLSQLRKMQCCIAHRSVHTMGGSPCWAYHFQSV